MDQKRSHLQIVFTSLRPPDADLTVQLCQQGYIVTLAHCDQISDVISAAPRSLVLVVVCQHETDITHFRKVLDTDGLNWLAWNLSDAPEITLAAFQHGARIVVPAQSSLKTLIDAVELIHMQAPRQGQPPASSDKVPPRQRPYRRGELIQLDSQFVLEVQHGVVAVILTHADGQEVLLGFWGSGQLLVAPTDERFIIHFVAHTTVIVLCRRWDDTLRDSNLPVQLVTQLYQQKQWTGILAQLYLDQRVLGILLELADRFAEPYGNDVLINVRVTHAQLASALGTTRSTISRIITNLRSRGKLATVKTEHGERFILPTLASTESYQNSNEI